MPKDKLADALWPEADGDLAHNSFEITLHRLRKLIGDSRCIQLIDGQVSLDPRYCSVDTWAFEHLYHKTEAMWQFGKKNSEIKNEAIRLSEKAIGIYKGHFLPADQDCIWSVNRRRDLRNKFIHIVAASGRYWTSKKQWERAAECFRHGLKLDGQVEEFYNQLAVCYKNLGLHMEAANVEKLRSSAFTKENDLI